MSLLHPALERVIDPLSPAAPTASKHVNFLFPLVVAFTAFQLYYVWIGGFGIQYLADLTYSQIERPYVYRVLLPFLAQVAEKATGMPAVQWMIVLVVLAGVGLYFSLRYLLGAFIQERLDLLAFMGTELFFLLILISPHPYDVATAFTFTLSFAFLARGRWLAYLALFPVATLNRETTFLLTLVWAAWGFFRLAPWTYIAAGAYQVAVWAGIRLWTMTIFADLPGASVDWQLIENFEKFTVFPAWGLLVLTLFAVTLWLVLRGWRRKPAFLRLTFVILFPLQLFLYLALGGIYELRVFSEIFSIAYTLAIIQIDRSVTYL